MASRCYLVDVNILVAAHVASNTDHLRARGWLEDVERFATCSVTEIGFLRIMTLDRVNPGCRPKDAIAALELLRNRNGHEFWTDYTTLADPRISLKHWLGAKQVTDLHLVNLAATYGGILATMDEGIEQALAPKDRRYVAII
jgi:toxin-antitoxin system PIN domain toxin